MRTRPSTRAAAAAVLLGTVLAFTVAAPALAEDYPSWDEVEAAKTDVAGRAAEVERITGLVSALQAEAGRLGDEAVRTAAESATADAALATASARASELDASANAADEAATAAGARFGRVTAMLARSGPTDGALALLFASAESSAGPGAATPAGSAAADTADPARLLMALSRTERLADLSSGIAAEATAARAVADSLSAQAEVAERERSRLADEARLRADSAQAAHERAEAAVAEQQGALDTMYAQLASLRDRSVELERQYQIGEQARQEADARAAAEAEASGGMTPAPPPGVVVDPAGAKAYARDAVARYGWGGGEYQCLVLLWTRESSWRADAYNTSSGAYGIPQALPGSKMAVAGSDWRTNAATQIEWGLAYISGRYGAPCGAWAHSESYNWY